MTHAAGDGAGRIDHVVGNTRIVLRPIASPLPLGLLAVMTGGVLLACEQIGAFPPRDQHTIALILLGFVVPLQLLATIFCFLARDTVAATGFGLFSGAWLASALTLMNSPPGQTDKAFGVFLLALAAAMFVIVAGASLGKAGAALVMIVGSARFGLTGLYELTGSTGLEHAAAIVGFVLAGIALYTALATEVEDVRGERKLPIGRKDAAASALDAPFADQLRMVENEAGVRQQL
jgi:succinate-acetate transporter protein